jgi:hypothetical protein
LRKHATNDSLRSVEKPVPKIAASALQRWHTAGERLGLTRGQVEHQTQGQHQFDRQVGVAGLTAGRAAPGCRPARKRRLVQRQREGAGIGRLRRQASSGCGSGPAVCGAASGVVLEGHVAALSEQPSHGHLAASLHQSHAAELLELGEAALDQMAIGIGMLVERVFACPRWVVRDHRDSALDGDGLAQRVGIVGSISHHDLGWQAVDQPISLRAIAALSGGESDANRIAEPAHGQVDLGA